MEQTKRIKNELFNNNKGYFVMTDTAIYHKEEEDDMCPVLVYEFKNGVPTTPVILDGYFLVFWVEDGLVFINTLTYKEDIGMRECAYNKSIVELVSHPQDVSLEVVCSNIEARFEYEDKSYTAVYDLHEWTLYDENHFDETCDDSEYIRLLKRHSRMLADKLELAATGLKCNYFFISGTERSFRDNIEDDPEKYLIERAIAFSDGKFDKAIASYKYEAE